MNERAFQSSKTAPLLHLFNRDKAPSVKFEDDVFTMWAKSGRTAQVVRADDIREIKLQKLPFLSKVTAQTKQGRGFRQFLLRSMERVNREWLLICTSHNLLKLFRFRRRIIGRGWLARVPTVQLFRRQYRVHRVA